MLNIKEHKIECLALSAILFFAATVIQISKHKNNGDQEVESNSSKITTLCIQRTPWNDGDWSNMIIKHGEGFQVGMRHCWNIVEERK